MKKHSIGTLEESRLLQQRKRSFLRVIFSRSTIVVVLLLLNLAVLFMLATQLLQKLPLLLGSMAAFTAVVLLIVVNGKQDASIKLAWAILIAVLPLPGTILYLFAQLDVGAKLSKKALAASISDSRAYLPASQEDTPLSGYLLHHGNAATYQNSQCKYYPVGEELFSDLLKALSSAEHFIFLEYFIIVPGYMWGEILKILHQKAKEGVEVRVMYDGTNAMINLPEDYPQQLEKLGIQCKVFSPVMPFLSTHYNNRDHRKILVVDGKVAFTGGINIQDRYINREQVFGHWKDTGIRVEGPATHGLTLLFLQLWNADEKEPVYEPYVHMPAPVSGDGSVIPFGDTPTDTQQIGKQVYLDILNCAKKYVYIMTPYLILDNEMENALKFASERGVDVRIILPHIPDKVSAFALARGHYQTLIEAGVRIFEYTPGFVHAKVFLSDDICGVVGTINLDYRSLYHHYECGVYLYQNTALRQVAKDFEDTLSQSQEITLAQAKHFPWIYRIGAKLLKAFAPLM